MRYSILLPMILLASCSPSVMTFEGPPNATQADLLTARYQCAKETVVEVSSGYLGTYSGSYGKTSLPSCSMMNACMAAKGYKRSEAGNLDASGHVIRCTN
jgi:hypothetical protein